MFSRAAGYSLSPRATIRTPSRRQSASSSVASDLRAGLLDLSGELRPHTTDRGELGPAGRKGAAGRAEPLEKRRQRLRPDTRH